VTRNAIFRFASLQSPLAARISSPSRQRPQRPSTPFTCPYYALPNEFLLYRSGGFLSVLKKSEAPWRSAAFLLQLLPRFLSTRLQRRIARHRTASLAARTMIAAACRGSKPLPGRLGLKWYSFDRERISCPPMMLFILRLEPPSGVWFHVH